MAKGQTQTLYSLAAVLGLVESGNKEDPFHMIVYRISGKTSGEQRPKKKTASPEYPGKMTAGQKAYAWRLLYDLAKLSPSAVPVGERMAGIVRKVLQEAPCPGHPLNWVKREDGAKLIEALKRYLRNAKRKAAKAHDSG